MPAPSTLLVFAVTALALVVVPGPNLVAYALAAGRAARRLRSAERARRRHLAGGVYLALAVAALAGGRPGT